MISNKKLTLEDCLRPHFKATLFLSYVKYIRKFYPDIDISDLFIDLPISESMLNDTNIWVSLKFERKFMDNIHKLIGKDITFDVGKFGASEEVFGKAFLLLSKLLSVQDLMSNIMRITSLVNKIIHVESINKSYTSLDIKITPKVSDLCEEDQILLNQSMPDMLRNIAGSYESIANLKGYLNAKVAYNQTSFKVSESYILNANLGVIQIANDSFPIIPFLFFTFINIIILFLYEKYIYNSIIISLFTFYFYKFQNEKKKSHYFAVSSEESLSNIELKNQKLQESSMKIQKRLTEFEVINQILEFSINNLSFENTLQLATNSIVEKLGYSRSFVLLKSNSNEYLEYQCQAGADDNLVNLLKSFKIPIDDKIDYKHYQFSYLFNNQKTILINDVDKHINSLEDGFSKKLLLESKSKSFVCVPIGLNSNKYGLLIADKVFSSENLDENDLKILENMAKQISLALQKIEMKKREAEILNSYSKFVPFSSIKLLGHSSVTDLKLGDSSEESLTVLFCDIRNFTKMCENMSPQDILRFLNSYIAHISPSIYSNNGFIDKFIGDCVMAIFINPNDAISSAVDMQRKLHSFNIQNRLGFRNPIEVAIGIHTGKSIFGPIGYGNKMELTVLSDNVNIASRVANLNKEFSTTILVSGESYKSWKNHENTRYLGPIKIRGRNLPVKIFEIIPDINNLDYFENEYNLGMINIYLEKINSDNSLKLKHKEELKKALLLIDIDNASNASKKLINLKKLYNDPIIDYHLNEIDSLSKKLIA